MSPRRSRPRAVRFLGWSIALLLTSVACSSAPAATPGPSGPSPGAVVTTTSAPAGAPSASPGAELPTRWPIKHVVFLMQENRSFDHLFGGFPGANGASFGWDH